MSIKTERRTSVSPAAAQAVIAPAKALVGWYTLLSVLTLGAIVLLRNDPTVITDAVWIRGTIVAVTALLMLSFASGAARGKPRALLRLRIVSALMVAVIAVIIILPGGFPTWMKIEQAVCGVLLLGVVAIVNGPKVRAVFRGR